MATQASLDRVQELYVAYYGRPADQEGQEYWADRLDGDEGESAIVNAFGNSAEYDELAEGKGNATLVDNLYQQMFGRHADPEGLTYYTGVLDRGEKSLAEIATTILNAASGEDQHEFDAKVEAAAEYTEKFGSADDYDVEDAQQVVADADGGVYQPDLTDALQTLQDAESAKEDFLESAAENELVENELTDGDSNDADDPDDVQPAETEAAITAAQSEIEQSLADARSTDGSDRVLQANLEDSEESVSDYQAEIDKVSGLSSAIEDKKAAVENVDAAKEAADNAAANLSGAEVTFGARNASIDLSGGVVYLDSDGTAVDLSDDGEVADIASVSTAETGGTELFTVEDGEVTVAESEATADLEGFDALQTAVQADLDTQVSLAEANEADSDADDALSNINDLSDADFSGLEATGTDVYDQLGTLEDGVEDAQTAVDDRADLVADAEEINGLADQLQAANDKVQDANDAIQDSEEDGGLGVTLTDFGSNASSADDLFVFSADANGSTVENFGDEGEDQIFVGTDFTRTDLDADATFTGEAQGDSSTLEVFFQQDGDNAVLNFENEAFAGSASGTEDLTKVTLVGVNVDDLQLDNGYISIA